MYLMMIFMSGMAYVRDDRVLHNMIAAANNMGSNDDDDDDDHTRMKICNIIIISRCCANDDNVPLWWRYAIPLYIVYCVSKYNVCVQVIPTNNMPNIYFLSNAHAPWAMLLLFCIYINILLFSMQRRARMNSRQRWYWWTRWWWCCGAYDA